MPHATPEWSEQRRHAANLVACVLYGVIAIMTVELAIDPGRFRYLEGAAAALVVGAVIAMTRFVVEVVKKETETGTHLPLARMAVLLWESWLVLAFPALVAAIIVVSGGSACACPLCSIPCSISASPRSSCSALDRAMSSTASSASAAAGPVMDRSQPHSGGDQILL